LFSWKSILSSSAPCASVIFLLSILSFAAAADAKPAEKPAIESLTQGKTVNRELTVGETHSYLLKLAADRTVILKFEKQGVAAVATLFSPRGNRLDTYGSTAFSSGTEQIRFVSEEGGEYRLDVRTFFKPTPPGRYLLTLVGVDAASDREISLRASQGCQESDWLDRENNFLVDRFLESFSACLSAVAGRLDSDFPQAGVLAGAANAQVSYLKSSWHWGEFVSPAYQQSLVQSFKVLASAIWESDKKKALNILVNIVDDIGVKAAHCRKSTRGLGADITVKVKTRSGTREDPGWVVYYKLGIFEFAEGRKPNRFTELSSPTSGILPAGRYLMWAWKPGLPEDEPTRKELFRIGDGMKELTLDLLVP